MLETYYVWLHVTAVEYEVADIFREYGYAYRAHPMTTDAPYRETPKKIAKRKEDGCLPVEMESANMMAIAQFREVILGQVLYGGDDLSGSEWNKRAWQSRAKIRESLFWLCADACLTL